MSQTIERRTFLQSAIGVPVAIGVAKYAALGLGGRAET